MNKLLYLIIALASLAVGAMVYVKSNNLALPEYALYYQQQRDIKAFEMTDHQGQVFNNASLQGKWSWVFFGYTSCPDVCPTTLQELNFAYGDLQAITPNNQVLLVSVDPARDSQDKLSQYINYFHPDFIALRAGHEVLFPFARNLGLMYAITDGDDAASHLLASGAPEQAANSYLVDHSASIVLINPKGKIAAIFKPQHQLGELPIVEGDKLVSDFAKVVALAAQLAK
ncbi:MAG: SCO family protein [Thalassotalea sp.]